MELVIKVLSVFALAMVELWAAIPAGLALGLDPVLTGGASGLGAATAVTAIVLLGEGARTWLLRRRGVESRSEHHGVVFRIWSRYGVIGLGLVAPLVTGAPLGAALGIALGAPARGLLSWMIVGIVLWSVVLTVAGVLGLEALSARGWMAK